tara:strand:- start:65 stop:706 length:642 start_codon:yes stop_codon:yes gene_type:complete
MPVLTKNNINVLLIRIPKTASTSLLKSFREDGWEYIINGGHKNSSWHFNKVSKDELHYCISVVRDPVDRFTSLYRMVFHQKKFNAKNININEFWNICKKFIPQDPYQQHWRSKNKIHFDNQNIIEYYLRPQTTFVQDLIAESNINTDIFIFEKLHFSNVYKKINSTLNINLTQKHERNLSNVIDSKLCKIDNNIKTEIQNYYAEDYTLINKFI